MEEVEVDARGLSCPEPVILAKKAIDDPETRIVKVAVNTGAGRDNVSRMARSQGCAVEIRPLGAGDFLLTIRKDS
ncbi:MAG TPA: sulfurtransferase TusA family protein [Sumerlaeia bacterium]|nr:sulfurtransferase TusA family protein [Sumerlaeia bacterium]